MIRGRVAVVVAQEYEGKTETSTRTGVVLYLQATYPYDTILFQENDCLLYY